jgi:hypothetical protein
LTHTFNQDPLEQHFGHYRHGTGDNSNPTVYNVRHMMTQMRAVGAQALAPNRNKKQKYHIQAPLEYSLKKIQNFTTNCYLSVNL